MRKSINGQSISDAKCAWDVTLVATVVFGGGADVSALHTMRCHIGSLPGRGVDDGSSAWRGMGTFIEVDFPLRQA